MWCICHVPVHHQFLAWNPQLLHSCEENSFNLFNLTFSLPLVICGLCHNHNTLKRWNFKFYTVDYKRLLLSMSLKGKVHSSCSNTCTQNVHKFHDNSDILYVCKETSPPSHLLISFISKRNVFLAASVGPKALIYENKVEEFMNFFWPPSLIP